MGQSEHEHDYDYENRRNRGIGSEEPAMQFYLFTFTPELLNHVWEDEFDKIYLLWLF